MPSGQTSSKGKGGATGKGKGPGPGGPTKKVGNPGNFHGARLQFLEAQLPIYLSKKGRTEVTDFFQKMLGLWWAEFPWYEGYGVDGLPLPKQGSAVPTTTTPAANVEAAAANAGAGGEAPLANVERPTASAPGNPTDGAPATSPDANPDANPDASAVGGVWAATGGVNPDFKDKIKAEVIAVRVRIVQRKKKADYYYWIASQRLVFSQKDVYKPF